MRLFLLFLLFIPQLSFGKTGNKAVNKSNVKIESYELLGDKGYAFGQILSNPSLRFAAQDTIYPKKFNAYWLRITIPADPGSSGENYFYISPDFAVKLYYRDALSKKWKTNSNGLIHPSGKRHLMMYSRTDPNKSNVLYALMDVRELEQKTDKFLPIIRKNEVTKFDTKENDLFMAWLITCIIILLYLFYISFDYAVLKERAHLYYLLILFGGLIYTTSFHKFFNLFTDFRFCRIEVISFTSYYYFDLNSLLNRLSLALITISYVQLTRRFLGTTSSLPKMDNLLRWCLLLCVAEYGISLSFTLFTPYYLDSKLISISNILLIITIILIFVTSVYSYRSGNKNARLFLVANSLPLLIIIGCAIYLNLFFYNPYTMMVLPQLGILSFAFTFSIALAVRTRYIRKELEEKELQTIILATENEKIQLQHDLMNAKSKEIEAELALEKAELEILQLKMDYQQRELFSSTLNISQKNEMLQQLKKEIDALTAKISPNEHTSNIKSLFSNHILQESNWETFKLHFEQVHPHFFEKLSEQHPGLTQNEIRLCAYLHLKLSNKEIAALQNIDPASVKRAKIRLKHKMNLGESDDLFDSMN